MSPRRRELIEPDEGAKRFIRRDASGRFVEDRPIGPSDEGAALRELHRRLVAIHHGLATGDVGDVDRDRRALERLDDALHFITEQPAYRAARQAERRAKSATMGHVVGGSTGGGMVTGGAVSGSAGVAGGMASGGEIGGPDTIGDSITRGPGLED